MTFLQFWGRWAMATALAIALWVAIVAFTFKAVEFLFPFLRSFFHTVSLAL